MAPYNLSAEDKQWLDEELEKSIRTPVEQRLSFIQFNLELYLAGKRQRQEMGIEEIDYEELERMASEAVQEEKDKYKPANNDYSSTS